MKTDTVLKKPGWPCSKQSYPGAASHPVIMASTDVDVTGRNFFNHVACLFLMGLFVWKTTLRAFELTDYVEAPPNLNIPEYPFTFFVVFGCALIGVVDEAAAIDSLEATPEFNYQGSGDISCIDASKESVCAFLETRKPDFLQ